MWELLLVFSFSETAGKQDDVLGLAGWRGGDFSAIVLHSLSLGFSPSLVPELRRPATTKVLSEGMKADTFETKLLLNSLNSSMAISASL